MGKKTALYRKEKQKDKKKGESTQDYKGVT